MSNAKVKLGKKIEPDKAKTLDRAQMAVLIGKQPQSDVEGQYWYEDLVQCPWCGYIGWAWINTDYWSWVTCGACGMAFEV